MESKEVVEFIENIKKLATLDMIKNLEIVKECLYFSTTPEATILDILTKLQNK